MPKCGESAIHMAFAPELHQVTGCYFASSKPRRSAKRSYDATTMQQLWQISAELVGLAETGANPHSVSHRR